MAELNVQKLKAYMGAGLNIALTGVHGVGKTAMLKEAAAQLNYKVKYYSASTLDPYTDLVGVPYPIAEEKRVEYFRPKEIDQADVVFFDELNRADQKTLNTILEIILDHSINGEPLPNLKCVVVAMNPVSEEYYTEELDHAILDRFDVFLDVTPAVNLGFFTKRFGDSVGKAAVEAWQSYHTRYTTSKTHGAAANAVAYLSPRRMEKITAAFVAIPTKETIIDCLPPEVVNTREVASSFFHKLNNAIQATKPPATPDGIRPAVREIIDSSIQNQRSAATGRKVDELLTTGNLNDVEKARLLGSLAVALNQGKTPTMLMRHFGTAVRAMDASDLKALMNGMETADQVKLQRLIAE